MESDINAVINKVLFLKLNADNTYNGNYPKADSIHRSNSQDWNPWINAFIRRIGL